MIRKLLRFFGKGRSFVEAERMPWSQSGPKNNPRCPSECKSRFQSQRNGKSPVLMTEVWERRMQVQRGNIILPNTVALLSYMSWILILNMTFIVWQLYLRLAGRQLATAAGKRLSPRSTRGGATPLLASCHHFVFVIFFFISNFVYVIFWPVGIFIIYVIFLAEQSMVAIRFKLTRSRTISRRTHVVTLSSLSS